MYINEGIDDFKNTIFPLKLKDLKNIDISRNYNKKIIRKNTNKNSKEQLNPIIQKKLYVFLKIFLSIFFISFVTILIYYYFLIFKNKKIRTSRKLGKLYSPKWIVITTINKPNSSIHKLLKTTEDWKIVVVGDEKTDDKSWDKYTYSNKLVYLSIQSQSNLGYKTLKYIPKNSYTRKNIGYLYAIQHGAKEIYETDDNNIRYSNFAYLNYNFNDARVNYIESDPSIMSNPYTNFGRPDIWPRGFRINDIGKKNNDKIYTTMLFLLKIKPMIMQGLINGNPDIDSFFRLSRTNINNEIDISFYYIYSLLYFPGNYIPINSKNTRYLYDVFPALALPISKNKRVSDIFRGYILQRYAWIYNGVVAYRQPSIYKKRNNINYNLEFKQEKELYYELDNLLNALNIEIKSDKENPSNFLIKLFEILFNKNIITDNDLNMYKSFIEDLSNIGYDYNKNFTTRVSSNINDYSNIYSKMNFYVPPKPDYLLRNNEKKSSPYINKVLTHPSTKSKYPNILLMINYNYEFLLSHNEFLKTLYIKYFPNMVFISPKGKNVTLEKNLNISENDTIIYCPESHRGAFSYFCITKVYEKFPNYDGYLFVMDDVFIKIWEFDNLDFNAPWIIGYSYDRATSWSNQSYIRMEKIYDAHPDWRKNIDIFLGKNVIPHGISDFYYIPKRLMKKFCELSVVFYKNWTFLELAVPNSLGIFMEPKYQYIYFIGLWGENRKHIMDYIHTSHAQVVVHPVKFSNDEHKELIKRYVYFKNSPEFP